MAFRGPPRLPAAAVLRLLPGMLALTAPAASAQQPTARLGRFEIPGLDWGPNAAWRVRARQVRDLRWSLLRRGDLSALNAPRMAAAARAAAPAVNAPAAATAVTGTFYVPVIPIAYKDVSVDYSAAEFEDVLFASTPPLGRPYTVKTFYEQVSNGMISMFGHVFAPVTADSNHSYYEQQCNGIGVRNSCTVPAQLRFGRMLIAALDSISKGPGADTVWSRYDNDGPDGIPNSGDDDGVVDFVTFLHPTIDGSCGGLGVWAHRWLVSVWNGGSPYLTKTPVRAANGQPKPGQFIKVDNYTIQSQVGGASGCFGGQIMPVGTITHETGHAFGLPDLYDTDVNGSGSEGVGEWSLMGSGNYSRAYSPSSLDAWSLSELGWVTIDTLTSTRVIMTRARQLSDTIFFAQTPVPSEYVLVENRQAVQSDTAALNLTNGSTAACKMNCRKQPGLLIWHIDRVRIAQGTPGNQINTGPIQGVALEQADGLNQLRIRNGNRGDAGDPYPGSTNNTRYALATSPKAVTNDSIYDGFVIDSIEQLAGGMMKFRFLRRAPSVVVAEAPAVRIRVNGQVVNRFEDVIGPGEQFTIGVDSAQTVNLGRTHARFLGWSIGGPRNQTVTSGAAPDTIRASFALEHQVQVAVVGSGQGTVTANRAGSLDAGIFVDQGTPVQLTATPAGGSVFAGWRGDTTAIASVVTLPMGRPFSLEAAFVHEVAVAVADATAEILGTSRLTVDQKQYLDQLGNRNGLYDLGDFLALLRRNGQAAPPALVRALRAGKTTRASVKGAGQ
jgi:M6 family metalloprotease-like protein